MDAIKFIKEYKRMCNSYTINVANNVDCCMDCPLYGQPCDLASLTISPQDIVIKIEQWSQTHPQKTMMQDFFEKFPNAPKTMLGFPFPCAKDLGYSKLDSCSFGLKNTSGAMCTECWSRPLEE